MGRVTPSTGRHPVRLAIRAVGLVTAALVVYLIVTAVQVWLTSRHYEPHHAGAIVVMGAAQYDGVPSPDLKSRLDEASSLWHEGYASTVMVTGGKEPGDRYTEAEASDRYLLTVGVPGRDILEAGGKDSWENLSDAAPVLLPRGDTTVLVVTDPFHEDRSLAIASSLQLDPSPTPTHTSPIRGFSAVPYFAKETLGVAIGRVIGFDHLSDLHSSLGLLGP